MDNKPDSRDVLLQRAWEWAGTSAALPRVAVGLLIAGILAVRPGFTTLLFVTGGKFIPWWMAGGALLAVAAVLVAVQASARSSVPEGDVFRWSELQIRWFWFPLGLCSVFCMFGMALDTLNDTRYTVVSENSAGCRLVARESTFLRAGSGTMFMAEPSGLALRVGSWRVDEGDRPARDGDIQVHWSGTRATYLVWGSLYGPKSEQAARCWTEAVRGRLAPN